jgi:hypothetical protein
MNKTPGVRPWLVVNVRRASVEADLMPIRTTLLKRTHIWVASGRHKDVSAWTLKSFPWWKIITHAAMGIEKYLQKYS